jgi:hypothetical protein
MFGTAPITRPWLSVWALTVEATVTQQAIATKHCKALPIRSIIQASLKRISLD